MRSSVLVRNLNVTGAGRANGSATATRKAPRWHQHYTISIYSLSGELSWQVLDWQVLSVFYCLVFARSAFLVIFAHKKKARCWSCLSPHTLCRARASSSSTEILALL